MERPTLRQLEYAVALADSGSFSRAAVECSVSQPGLSAQVAELERRLGVVLFERTRSGSTPTPAGVEMLARARAVLRDVDDVVRAADAHRDTVAGVLRVAAIPTIAPYLLSTVARQLRRLWPDVQLELSEMRTSDLVAAAGEARIDLGLLATPIETAGLAVANLAFEPFVVAVSDGNPLARHEVLDIEELGDVEILLLEDGHCLREHALAACKLAGATNHRDVHHTGLSVLAQTVASSETATFLPASAVAVEAREGSGLVTIPLRGGAIGRTVSLVWRPSDPRCRLYANAVPHAAAVVETALSAGRTPGST